MKITKYVKSAIVGLGTLALISGCATSGKIIKSEEVKSIPDKKYEKIIALRLPEGEPIDPYAGFVYVLPEGKIGTDFPRVEFLKNIDGLLKHAQSSRTYRMGKFIIKDSEGKVRGYYEMLPGFRTIIWEYKDDILLQIIIPDYFMDRDGFGHGRKMDGGHGGK
jgi:hypothetical protein